MTTFSAASDNLVGIVTTFGFHIISQNDAMLQEFWNLCVLCHIPIKSQKGLVSY